MFKNASQYTKMWAALLTWLVGAVPVIIASPDWKHIVAYVVPGVAGVLAVYLMPNSPPPSLQAPVSAPVTAPDK